MIVPTLCVVTPPRTLRVRFGTSTQSIGTIGVITTKSQTAGKKIPATEVAGIRFKRRADQLRKAAPVCTTLAEPSSWLMKRLHRVMLAGPTNTTS